MLFQFVVGAALAVGMGDEFKPGDLLVTGLGFGDVSPSSMGHYRADGAFVQEIFGTGEFWVGAAALGNGKVATAYGSFDELDGVNILSEDGGELISFKLAALSEFGNARDPSVFADGTLAVLDNHGFIMLYEQDGTHVETLDCPANALEYSDVDSSDRLWVVDTGVFGTPRAVYVMNREGDVLDSLEFAKGFAPGDLVVNDDGTFWITGFDDGFVYLMNLDGDVLESFEAGYFDHMFGSIAVAPDATIWTANNNAKIIRHWEPDGTLIKEIGAQHSCFAIAQMDIVPAAVCAADCNGDGALNVLDFVCFQQEWQGQTPSGDCDGNGVYNVLDFVCFQGQFQAGCP
jgi:hypothetical protein